MKKYLIFDFDGVLADTKETNIRALYESGYQPSMEAAREFEETYANSKPMHGRNHTMTDEELHAMYEEMAAFGKKVHEIGFSMFDEFIDEVLKLEDTKIAIVSSGSQQYVIPAIADSKLEPTHILAFENHHSKEEKVEIVCKDWGIDPKDAYYFTDTLVDVYELQNMISEDKLIGVSWGYCAKESLRKELKREYVLNNPSDFTQFFL